MSVGIKCTSLASLPRLIIGVQSLWENAIVLMEPIEWSPSRQIWRPLMDGEKSQKKISWGEKTLNLSPERLNELSSNKNYLLLLNHIKYTLMDYIQEDEEAGEIYGWNSALRTSCEFIENLEKNFDSPKNSQ